MNTETKRTLNAIEILAAEVASEHDAELAARRAEQEAEAAVLDAAVVAVKPALKALSGSILQRSWASGQSTDKARHGATYHPEQGIRVAGGPAEEDAPRDTAGSYEGAALYLLTDGTFAVVRWTGEWSRWQGAGDTVEGELTVLQGDALEVFRAGWKLDEILASLSTALVKHASNKPPTKAMQERADRLAALAKGSDGKKG